MLTGRKAVTLKAPSEFTLFGVRIANRKMKTAIKIVMNSLEIKHKRGEAATFAFVNADCANHYYDDNEYKSILNSFTDVFPDGIGVKIAARHQGLCLKENVNGNGLTTTLNN